MGVERTILNVVRVGILYLLTIYSTFIHFNAYFYAIVFSPSEVQASSPQFCNIWKFMLKGRSLASTVTLLVHA